MSKNKNKKKSINVALDFDGTYTEAPEVFDALIDGFLAQGHKVFLVTMRFPDEVKPDIEKLSEKIPVIYTSRNAKMPFVESQNIKIDIWIDDNPHWIFVDSE